MTTLALIASPGKIRALKIGLVRHLNTNSLATNVYKEFHSEDFVPNTTLNDH